LTYVSGEFFELFSANESMKFNQTIFLNYLLKWLLKLNFGYYLTLLKIN